MIEKIQRVVEVIDDALVAIASASAIYLDHALSGDLKTWSAYVAVGAVSIAYIAMRVAFRFAVKRSNWIRRAIAGDEFVEGVWVESYSTKSNDTSHVGIITITCDGESFRLSGTTWNISQKTPRGGWKSVLADCESSSMQYVYQEEVAGSTLTGSGRLDFKIVQGAPIYYQSKIFDRLHNAFDVGFGIKVQNAYDRRALLTGNGFWSVLQRYAEKAHASQGLHPVATLRIADPQP